ncbi:hypothetical protein LSCM1_07961 [Leishmania martiniquensis]|uniref:tRNA/rRNA methyltransferase SpoU type domain-containing protein n=1 Tax=Leishmania martiniquensis TaxID=1580590 RepID=A0A836HI92_9TRYP|nr:hypothetical protein LSCM1_07961 [Leishmania martiniquensis]
MPARTFAAALRYTRPLLAYNKSSGYRWSPIPKPPPPHYDRLYGVHSVLNTLRVAAQQQQQQKAADTSRTTRAAKCAPSTTPRDSHPSSTTAARAPLLHPNRAHLACLYVRDFSLEKVGDGSIGADDGASSTSSALPEEKKSHRPERGPPMRRKKAIPRRYVAVRCITALAESLKVPVRFVPRAELVQLCGERRNQSVVLEVSSYKPKSIRHLGEIWGAESAAATAADAASATAAVAGSALGASPSTQTLEGSGGVVTVLFLERVIDPTNVGGILRTAFFFGIDHVVLSRHCATCTAAVSRTSTGFLEHLHVYRAATSSAAFLRASREVWASRASPSSATAASGLEVIASAAVSHTRAERRDACESTPALPSCVSGDSALSEVSGEKGDDHACACRQMRQPYPSSVRVLLLGNEDAGLPPDLLQWCTHVAHIRSPRQARLRHVRTSSQGAARKEDAEVYDMDTEVDSADVQVFTSPLDSATDTSAASAEALDTHQHSLRRLARVRDKEVSLNVNTATAALLSALCGVDGPLGNGSSHLGLVDVQPMCSP